MNKVLLNYADFTTTIDTVFDIVGNDINGSTKEYVFEAIKRYGERMMAKPFADLVNEYKDMQIADIKFRRNTYSIREPYSSKVEYVEKAFFLLKTNFTADDVLPEDIILEAPLHSLEHALEQRRIIHPHQYIELRGAHPHQKLQVINKMLDNMGLILLKAADGESTLSPDARFIVAQRRVQPRCDAYMRRGYLPKREKKAECKSIW